MVFKLTIYTRYQIYNAVVLCDNEPQFDNKVPLYAMSVTGLPYKVRFVILSNAFGSTIQIYDWILDMYTYTYKIRVATHMLSLILFSIIDLDDN